MCKWALCTTTLFWLCCCMGCIRHVDVPGQQNMATMGGCAPFSRALGVSQILVLQHYRITATEGPRPRGGAAAPPGGGRALAHGQDARRNGHHLASGVPTLGIRYAGHGGIFVISRPRTETQTDRVTDSESSDRKKTTLTGRTSTTSSS